MNQEKGVCKISEKELDLIIERTKEKFQKLLKSNGKEKLRNAFLSQVKHTKYGDDYFLSLDGNTTVTWTYEFSANWNALKEPLMNKEGIVRHIASPASARKILKSLKSLNLK